MERKISDTHKKCRTVLTIVQSALICLLILLVVTMMAQINSLQGTARVINYAGIVRGATQRLVKLEITEHPDDTLLEYLDDILTGLTYGDGVYDLVSLDNALYQEKLASLRLYWEDLKAQIEKVRADGYAPEDQTVLLHMSEVYFSMADDTVSAAETYSNKITSRIQVIEVVSAVDMCQLIAIIMWQSISAVRMRKRNAVLARKAYIDLQTGLNNKNMCEELLESRTVLSQKTLCLMFDINNLKVTNDTFGHSVGDRLIVNFAKILKDSIREGDFAGRCGGDEFILMLDQVDENTAQAVLARIREKVEQFNRVTEDIPISYAQGWSLSTNYKSCTYRKLFDEADRAMYANKQNSKGGSSVKTGTRISDPSSGGVPFLSDRSPQILR